MLSGIFQYELDWKYIIIIFISYKKRNPPPQKKKPDQSYGAKTEQYVI